MAVTGRHSLWFTAPHTVEVREESVPPPGGGQVLVQTSCSAISGGTELLIYRGEAPAGLAADESIPALNAALAFPLKYGYAAVGRVIAVGPGVDPAWQTRQVVAFNPHESYFVAAAEDLISVPSGLDPEDAAFLPAMETAVNFLLDGAPLIGERVAVFGQGAVGLLTTALLSRLPLESLITLDRYPRRREMSMDAGAHASFNPLAPDALAQVRAALQAERSDAGADLTYEVSGAPAALEMAVAATAFAGRIVIGSWYGTRRADLDLGGRFHRSRIRLISSQVSTLTPGLMSRWTKSRRLQVALGMLAAVRPSRFITHRVPLGGAADAYQQLDQRPDEAVQVLLTY